MNATTEQAEGWQSDMRDRNAALQQLAHQVQALKFRVRELEDERDELIEEIADLREDLRGG